MTLLRIDHFVLTVASLEATCAFYRRTLEMDVIHYGNGRVALGLGDAKINLHEAGREFDPKARMPSPGSGDFCLLTDTPVADIAEHLSTIGVDVEEGPVERTGAQGPILSIYFRDPDGNLVEVSNQTRAAEEEA